MHTALPSTNQLDCHHSTSILDGRLHFQSISCWGESHLRRTASLYPSMWNESRSPSKLLMRLLGKRLASTNRVWLYIPAVKTGRNRKLASLWRGPYTVIGKTGPVTYRVELIGSTKCLVLHRNRLKLCYGEPGVRDKSTRTRQQPRLPAAPDRGISETRMTSSSDCTVRSQTRSSRTYADAVAGHTSSEGVDRDNQLPQPDGSPISQDPLSSNSGRPQRNRRPPSRYRDYVSH